MLVQRPIRQQRDGYGQPDAEAVGPELPAGKGGGHTAQASTHFAMEWGGVLGCLQWAAWQVLAVLVSLPLAMSLLVQFIISPRKVLHHKDRSNLLLPDPLPGLLHQWIEAQPGVKLHIARTSRGSGKPLMLLVHGFPEAWFTWAKQMADFRDQYEVVAVDMRGYGESSKPKGWLSYHQYHLADDLLAVTEHLLQESGQKQVVLAGHDWGGHMCWCLAYMAPHLFSHLITLCVPHPGLYHKNRDLTQRIRHSYVLAFQLPWLGEAALCVNDYALLESVLVNGPGGCNPGTVSQEYIERYKQAFGRPGVPTAALNYYRAVNNALFPTEKLHRLLAGKLLVPTLMLWGGRDINLSQVLLRDTDKHVDRLRVEVLPDSSHWMLQDCPAEVNRLMRDFLQA
ncbi:hypothetical protein D9Q98_002522 [Chlorella vulgaris]|uniref:AB hydrolase-1 domain-containing protein n=1 Tax=Chlorella vulgaris TaxID=3077 RepID=A0A9D4TUT8_CHLVU|nr:hypothetical protein D9Q98_002522 [Chlorella vulgaris]